MANVKEKNEVYKCAICGNIVEVLTVGGGELVCCNQPMELLEAKNQDQGSEKHVPVIKETENRILVKVGEVSHPMEVKHWINWIEIITKDGKNYRKFLNFGDQPQAEFCLKKEEIETVREFCNVHGLWKK